MDPAGDVLLSAIASRLLSSGEHHTASPARAHPRDIACFCEYCQAKGRERGYDPRRAMEGCQALYDLYERAMYGGAEQPPSDGYFVTFWRTLLRYPEILAWE